MDIIDALDEIKQKNAQTEAIDGEALLAARLEKKAVEVEEKEIAEEAWVRELFFSADDGAPVRRVVDGEGVGGSACGSKGKKRVVDDVLDLGIVISKKQKGVVTKAVVDEEAKKAEVEVVKVDVKGKGKMLVADYGSDSD
jgi:hypothetical protein